MVGNFICLYTRARGGGNTASKNEDRCSCPYISNGSVFNGRTVELEISPLGMQDV